MNRSPAGQIRALLLFILVFSLVGTGTELLLLGHVESGFQRIPIGLIAFGVIVLVWYGAVRNALSLRIFQWTMLLFLVAGVTGIGLHFKSNIEFEKEMYPTMTGWELFGNAMSGAMPALAPGAMIQIGLLGLAYTFRHPVLSGFLADTTTQQENSNETRKATSV